VEAEKKRNKYYKRCQECLKKENWMQSWEPPVQVKRLFLTFWLKEWIINNYQEKCWWTTLLMVYLNSAQWLAMSCKVTLCSNTWLLMNSSSLQLISNIKAMIKKLSLIKSLMTLKSMIVKILT
jgi:hypothetical protein